MANRERGHIAFEVTGADGKKRTYTLVANMRAWAEAQDVLTRGGRKPPTMELLIERINQESMIHIMAVFYGMLQAHHHEEFRTLDDVSAFMEQHPDEVLVALKEALFASQADPADVRELATGRPPAAQARTSLGTGGRSRSRRALSA